MPRIESYQSRVGAAAPAPVKEQSADVFGAAEARSDRQRAQELEGFGKAVVGFGEYQLQETERKETSKLAADLSTFQDEQATDLEGRIRAGDDNLVDNFTKSFDEKMSKFGENLSTQAGMEFFQKTRANQRSEFIKLASSGQAEVAGAKAVSEFGTVLEKQSSFVQKTPASFPAAKAQILESIKSVQGLMPLHKVNELREASTRSLAEAAVRGLIMSGDQGPGLARQQLLAGNWDEDLTSKQKHALYGEANSVARARRVDASVARTEREEAKKIAGEKIEDEYIKRLYDKSYQEQHGALQAIDVTNSKLAPDKKRLYIGILEKTAGKDNPENPKLYNALLRDIERPIGDPLRIDDPDIIISTIAEDYGGMGKLPAKKAEKLKNILSKNLTAEGMIENRHVRTLIKTYKDQITGGEFGIKDEQSSQRLYEFQYDLSEKIEQYKKEKKDWRDLFNPKKADFFGNNVPNYLAKADDYLDKKPQPVSAEPSPVPKTAGTKLDPQIQAFATKNGMDYEVAARLLAERKRKRGLPE